MEKQCFEPAFPMIPPAPPHGVEEEHTIGSGWGPHKCGRLHPRSTKYTTTPRMTKQHAPGSNDIKWRKGTYIHNPPLPAGPDAY